MKLRWFLVGLIGISLTPCFAQPLFEGKTIHPLKTTQERINITNEFDHPVNVTLGKTGPTQLIILPWTRTENVAAGDTITARITAFVPQGTLSGIYNGHITWKKSWYNPVTISVGNNTTTVSMLNQTTGEIAFKITVTSEEEKNATCLLGLQTIGTLTFTRGQGFFAHTVDINSKQKKPITNVEVTIVDNGVRGNPVITNLVSNSLTGSLNPWIPRDVVGPFVASLITTQDSNKQCKPNDVEILPGVPYGQYIEENPEFQLEIYLGAEEYLVGKEAKGMIRNVAGDKISESYLRIINPSGEEKTVRITNSSFSYQLNSIGEYMFKVTKENYKDSDQLTVTSLTDADGDEIPNRDDRCPDEKGIELLEGCPKMETKIQVPHQRENLFLGKEYIIKLVDRDERMINYTGPVKVNGVTYDVNHGEGNFTVGEVGEVQIKFDGSDRYKPTTNKFTAKKSGIHFPLGPFGSPWFLAFMFACAIMGVVWYWRKKGMVAVTPPQIELE